MTDYQDVISRIKKIYESSTLEQQSILKQILHEIATDGYSKTYEDVWLADYKEIPVDKATFLTDPYYLGSTNDNGESIYPAWWDMMMELEETGNQYYEIVLTGATRTGKSSTAVSDAAYNLYKLMCLRDPAKYFGLKSVTTILIFFFNLNEKLAKGVAFKEFNNTLRLSPYFNEHGSFTPSKENPVFIPEGGFIQIKYGSSSSHALGAATYCLVGNTEILTSDGIKKLEDIVGTNNIAQYSDDGNIVFSNADVIQTKYVKDTIRITLEDGSIIEGTPDHKILLSNGEYKKLQNITEDDDILAF